MSATNREGPGSVTQGDDPTTPEQAFDRFLEERYTRLVGTVNVIVHDRSLAEDIVQETFAKAHLQWHKLWPDGNPGGWAHRVATNLAISWRRRVAREVKAVARLGKQTSHETRDPEPHPELRRAVAALPPRQRAAVALHYTLGLSIDEAAEAMHVRPGTVKSLLFDARQRLKKELGDDG